MPPAVILAAGSSSRMGTPKALLPAPDGRAFIARIVRTFLAAGISDIVVVTGAHHDAIVAAIADDGPPAQPRFARNLDPERGQLSSVWTGMDASVTRSTEGLLLTLVDVPMVAATTVRHVVEAWRRSRAPIVRPAIGDRHGHPVLFDRRLFDELRAAPLDRGAKVVVRAHEHEIVNVPVDDDGCLVDIDTPADYQRLRG